MHYNTFGVIEADPQEFVAQGRSCGRRAVVVKPGGEYKDPLNAFPRPADMRDLDSAARRDHPASCLEREEWRNGEPGRGSTVSHLERSDPDRIPIEGLPIGREAICLIRSDHRWVRCVFGSWACAPERTGSVDMDGIRPPVLTPLPADGPFRYEQQKHRSAVRNPPRKVALRGCRRRKIHADFLTEPEFPRWRNNLFMWSFTLPGCLHVAHR